MATTAAAQARAVEDRGSWIDRGLVTTGLVGGGIVLYFMAVGMVEKFNSRNILADVLALGRLLLLLTLFFTGYMAGRRLARRGHVSTPRRVAGGLLAGAIAGAMGGVTLLIVNAIGTEHVRRMFVSLNSNLVENILSFGQSVPFGATVMVVGGAAVGAAGAALEAVSPRIRRATLTGIVASILVSLAFPFVSQVFRNLESNFRIDLPLDFFYTAGGLAYTGLIVVFGVAFGVSWWRSGRAERSAAPPTEAEPLTGARSFRDILRSRWVKALGWLALLTLLVLIPFIVGPFLSQVINTVGIYVLLGLGLNIVVGFAGLLDLGYVAFFAVGAYAMAIFTSTDSFLARTGAGGELTPLLNFWTALPVVVVVGVVAGLLIGAPVLRLRGDYLAIVTLGFGEIARVFIASIWLQEYLGGAQGILRIPGPPPDPQALRRPENLYYIILAFSLIAAFVALRLKDSRVGRAWAAMREDETVAEAMGVSVINYKLLAFMIGAGVGCLGGAFFAIQVGSVFPNSMDILVSINALSVIVLGGIGSIPGVVLGAFGLVGLPELLREFEEFRLLIYGGLLVALMILKPEGLLPEVRRKRELHERELEEEQYEERVGEGAEPVVRAEPREDEES